MFLQLWQRLHVIVALVVGEVRNHATGHLFGWVLVVFGMALGDFWNDFWWRRHGFERLGWRLQWHFGMTSFDSWTTLGDVRGDVWWSLEWLRIALDKSSDELQNCFWRVLRWRVVGFRWLYTLLYLISVITMGTLLIYLVARGMTLLEMRDDLLLHSG